MERNISPKEIFLYLYSHCKYRQLILQRKNILKRFLRKESVKIYYGCGNAKQNDYINIDVRWTPSVDIIGDLQWCSINLLDSCDEVYLSHVLEHYSFPGKDMRHNSSTVLGALLDIYKMLKPGGVIRIAVPDFEAISKLYLDGKFALFPRLAGRLCGEQNYRENLHKCMFDRKFLIYCLEWAGFENVEEWDPKIMKFEFDASFDHLDGERTSLNLIAQKL